MTYFLKILSPKIITMEIKKSAFGFVIPNISSIFICQRAPDLHNSEPILSSCRYIHLDVWSPSKWGDTWDTTNNNNKQWHKADTRFQNYVII